MQFDLPLPLRPLELQELMSSDTGFHKPDRLWHRWAVVAEGDILDAGVVVESNLANKVLEDFGE